MSPKKAQPKRNPGDLRPLAVQDDFEARVWPYVASASVLSNFTATGLKPMGAASPSSASSVRC